MDEEDLDEIEGVQDTEEVAEEPAEEPEEPEEEPEDASEEEPEEAAEDTGETVEEGDRLQGTVKWYNRAKGYGFVEGDDEDYFVHYSQLPEGTIVEEGDQVSFEAVETEKGWQAQEVEILE